MVGRICWSQWHATGFSPLVDAAFSGPCATAISLERGSAMSSRARGDHPSGKSPLRSGARLASCAASSTGGGFPQRSRNSRTSSGCRARASVTRSISSCPSTRAYRFSGAAGRSARAVGGSRRNVLSCFTSVNPEVGPEERFMKGRSMPRWVLIVGRAPQHPAYSLVLSSEMERKKWKW